LAYRLYRGYLDRVDAMARKNRELHTMYERAHAESLTDALTELPNRRFIVAHAEAEIARARREGYEVAFLVVDINDFKAINDRCGPWRRRCAGGCGRTTRAAAMPATSSC